MIEREDIYGTVVLRLAHGKANALDYELSRAIIECLDETETGDAEAVVLTGSGKIFSAGVDLFRVLNEDDQYLDAFYPMLVNMFARVFAFRKPLVAAVNGHAVAGGCVLACACDFRVMGKGGGTMGVPELRVGVPFPTVAMEILRYTIDNAHLQAMVLSGDTVTAEDALRLGLVDELADGGKLMDRALERAKTLASIPARSYGLSKRQLREPAVRRIEARSSEDEDAVRAAWMDPATLEHIRGYLDKTIGKSR